MPGSGKTQLYHYLVNGEIPQTVKSAQTTTYEGYLDCNKNLELVLHDVPSDPVI
jgi:hypothetical protein